jgi:hypothetical protein
MKRIRVYCCIGMLCGVGPASGNDGTEVSGRWAISVRRISATAADLTGLWIGIQNGDTNARAACISHIQYVCDDVGSDGGVDGGTLIGQSPHSCSMAWQAHLVLGGETYFVMADAPKKRGGNTCSAATIRVGVMEQSETGAWSGPSWHKWHGQP